MTADYFAFADFTKGNVGAPSSPGIGYMVTRWYTEGSELGIFDRLLYYPASGFVFYDGVVYDPSEYDGLWYIASPEIKEEFNMVLRGEARRDLWTFVGTFVIVAMLIIAFIIAQRPSKDTTTA